MIRIEGTKLKKIDRRNANEILTKNLYERFSSYFLPATEVSMKKRNILVSI